jgi:hypothetical protein
MMLGAAAVVVLGLSAWSYWPSTPVPGTSAPAQARARAGRTGAAPVEGGPVGPVRLDALKASRDEPGQAARNPFRFQPKVVPPSPRETPISDPALRPAPPVPTGPPPPPPVPPIGLKLIGVVERANGVKWAVLSDGKSAPMHGKDGDIIDGRYLIVKIGSESVEMSHADGRGRQVIRLTGQ